MSIYLYDFNDSFTYNIYSEVYHLNKDIKVIKKSDSLSHLESLVNTTEKSLIILGPGPGHPNEYFDLNETLKKLLKCDHISILGICLGHQLIAQALGMSVHKSQRPVHGESIYYQIPLKLSRELSLPEKFNAQRYNSLAIRLDKTNSEVLSQTRYESVNQDQEYIIFYGDRLLTYQFHPESIGTNYRNLFFKKPLSFLL